MDKGIAQLEVLALSTVYSEENTCKFGVESLVVKREILVAPLMALALYLLFGVWLLP